ncbi:mRNA-capping enzyme [Linum grandiflorum]
MDLNALPLPKGEEVTIVRAETSVQIARREREERRKRLRTASNLDDRPRPVQRQRVQDQTRVPPGWSGCPEAGEEIFGIVPSKVPLGERFYHVIPPGNRYPVKQVIKKQRILGRKLGLVIDLTNTDRYYERNEFENAGIKYIKVTKFLSLEKLSKVLVHCTHGHNRTGYMIVHFLKRTQSMSVTEAITKFAEARPPGIYKSEYIDALYDFYHEPKPDNICPPVPEWKISSEGDHDDGDGVSAPPSNLVTFQDNRVTKLTNDDVLGDDIPVYQRDRLRKFCYEMLKMNMHGGNPKFPGSHPVSLSSENLQLLIQHYYYATWKADGTRYMMLLAKDGCYLVDRSFNFRRVQMRFPCMIGGERAKISYHDGTLLDGEMVIDTDRKTNVQRRCYLIYDLMAINKHSVVELPFGQRWDLIDKEVTGPRKYEQRDSRNQSKYEYEKEPFRVERKNFWMLSAATKILKMIPTLPHKSDGLIFQGWDQPYVPDANKYLLKWKYADMNSVDFLFEVGPDGRQSLYLGGRKKLTDGSSVVFRDGDPSSYSGKIIECSYNSEENVWVFMRLVFGRQVKRSIEDNITEDILMAKLDEISSLPMYAERRMEYDRERHRQMAARASNQQRGDYDVQRG